MTKHKKKTSPDFAQKTGKVGKKKRAENETRTVFKSRLISVPMQAALEREQQGGSSRSDALTHRKLSLTDLLPRLTHSNSQVRQEALLGIRDLARDYPSVVRMSVGTVLEKLSQLITDMDKTVRSHLRLAFSQVLWALPPSATAPFMHLVVAYLCSGMTFSAEAVKSDTIELAALILDRYPSLATDYSRQLLPRFSALIAPHSTGLRSLAQSQQASNNVLSDNNNNNNANSAASNAAGSTASFSTRTKALGTLLKFIHVLTNGQSASANLADITTGLFCGLPAPSDAVTTAALTRSSSMLAADDAETVLLALHPGLIELWHEATPLTPLVHTQTLKGVLETIDLLLEATFETNNNNNNSGRTSVHDNSGAIVATAYNRLKGCLDDYVKCIHPFFPFDSTGLDERGTSSILELNLLVCKVFSRFLSVSNGMEGGDKCKRAGSCSCWAASLIRYMCFVLRGYVSVEEQNDIEHADKKAQDEGSNSLTVNRLPTQLATFVAHALPVLHAFMKHLSRAQQAPLRRCFTVFSDACPPASTARFECIRFATDVLSPRELLAFPDTREWVGGLPKLLWQLKDKARETAGAALELLLACAKSAPAAADFVQPTLVPFFFTVVEKRGNTLKLYGPFLDLEDPLRRTALNVLHYLDTLSRPMERAIVACICSGRLSPQCLRLAVELLEYHHYWKSMSLPALAASYAAIVANLPRTDPPSTFMSEITERIVLEICASLRRVGANVAFAATLGTLLDSLPLSVVAHPYVLLASACAIPSVASSDASQCFITFLTNAAAHVMLEVCVDGGKNKVVIGTMETLLAAYPQVLAAVIGGIVSKIGSVAPEEVSLSEWAALTRIAEMPALRRPELLLDNGCRKLLIPLLNAKGVPQHILPQYSEFCQVMSTLYSL